MTQKEIAELSALLKPYNSRLAKWILKAKPSILTAEDFGYGDSIPKEGTQTVRPRVGIVRAGYVEIQGPILAYGKDHGYVRYPVALRGPGEVIGELEFLYYRTWGPAYVRPWRAFAGMRTFYFTRLENSKEYDYFNMRERLGNLRKSYPVSVVWIESQFLDDPAIDCLRETAVERLLPLDSCWIPSMADFRAANVSTFATDRAIHLFYEICRALQGVRVGFHPMTVDAAKAYGPWSDTLIKEYSKGKDYLLLGIQPSTKSGEPIVLLPHFFTDSLADPDYPHSKAPDLPNDMRADIERVVQMAGGYWINERPFIPHDQSTLRRVVACYTMKDKTKAIECVEGATADDAVGLLAEALGLQAHCKCVSDLLKLGMLGSASLVILPHGK
jgi:hypothetical protein